jgi:hypothetical protein
MRMSDIEDWALALTMVFAVVFTATINQGRHAHAAVAANFDQSQPAPQFAMTITAKRLPAMCKGADAAANALYCASFLEADAVVEMHETAAGYAVLNNALDADIAYNR